MHSQGHGSVKLLSSVAVASNFPVPDSATDRLQPSISGLLSSAHLYVGCADQDN